ncbi:hypothetical protein TYRP_009107 [Tyrophagus putrescentiae]|nr:hypothetical protein TYRP_009107 [Tyrophagus putrescentiae]
MLSANGRPNSSRIRSFSEALASMRGKAEEAAIEQRPADQRAKGVGGGGGRLCRRIDVAVLGGKLLVHQFGEQRHQRRVDAANAQANAKVRQEEVEEVGHQRHEEGGQAEDEEGAGD